MRKVEGIETVEVYPFVRSAESGHSDMDVTRGVSAAMEALFQFVIKEPGSLDVICRLRDPNVSCASDFLAWLLSSTGFPIGETIRESGDVLDFVAGCMPVVGQLTSQPPLITVTESRRVLYALDSTCYYEVSDTARAMVRHTMPRRELREPFFRDCGTCSTASMHDVALAYSRSVAMHLPKEVAGAFVRRRSYATQSQQVV